MTISNIEVRFTETGQQDIRNILVLDQLDRGGRAAIDAAIDVVLTAKPVAIIDSVLVAERRQQNVVVVP